MIGDLCCDISEHLSLGLVQESLFFLGEVYSYLFKGHRLHRLHWQLSAESYIFLHFFYNQKTSSQPNCGRQAMGVIGEHRQLETLVGGLRGRSSFLLWWWWFCFFSLFCLFLFLSFPPLSLFFFLSTFSCLVFISFLSSHHSDLLYFSSYFYFHLLNFYSVFFECDFSLLLVWLFYSSSILSFILLFLFLFLSLLVNLLFLWWMSHDLSQSHQCSPEPLSLSSSNIFL